MENFRRLGVIEPILKSIEESRFEKPSEVQEKSIPLILAGRDVIAGSATGSGKTLAFAAGIIQNCEKGRGLQSLILTPTRELADQITKVLRRFSRHKPLEIIDVYGGVSINPQIDCLRTADVVVGTPGRILDHIGRNTINLRNVKILVLDEADRMFDMGFKEDVEEIIRHCPNERQTLLFSATISDDIARMSRRHMKSPVRISVESYVDPRKLVQVYYNIPDNMKFSLLVYLLKNERSGLVMVFCNTQRNTDFVARNLRHEKIDAIAIHGGFSQAKRNNVMKQFHSQNFSVLVCTDVAARGLDIKGVSHVYNYDVPKESKQYIHRIGRTARAGKEGLAITILSTRDYDNFDRVLRDNAVEIKKREIPQIPRVMIRFMDRPTGFERGPRRFGNRQSSSFSGGRRGFGSPRRSEGDGDFGRSREFSGVRKGPGRRHSY